MNKLSQEVIAGNRSALARAITLVESTLTEHQQEAQSILQDILAHSGQSLRIGIT
ncbi:MAG TPA: methylmalonyl Co-A mutase-associated GTPase MeaB, partial [Flavobacteriales bacterium]|nr:methylmalonyl Co-A mutase-associated GTPase MeaB [Flavobacteriales bacterium]